MRKPLGPVIVVAAALLLAAACGGDEPVGPEDLVPAGVDFVLKVRVADILDDPDTDAIYREVAKDEDGPQTLGELLDRVEESIGIVRQVDELVAFGALSDLSDSGEGGTGEISFTEVLTLAKQDGIQRIEVQGQKLTVITRSGEKFRSRIGKETDIMALLNDEGVETGSSGVDVKFNGSGGLGSLFGILILIRGELEENEVIAALERVTGEPSSSTEYKGRRIHAFDDEDTAFTLLEDDILVIGAPDIVRKVVDVRVGDAERASGHVYDAFSSVGDPLIRVAAVLPEDSLENLDLPFGVGGAGLDFVKDVQGIVLAVDKDGSDVKAQVRVDFTAGSSATDAHDAIDALLTLARLAAPGEEAAELLEALDLSVSGTRVTADLEVTVSELKELVGSLGGAAGGLGGLFGIRSESSGPLEPRIELRSVPAPPAHTSTPRLVVPHPTVVGGVGSEVSIMAAVGHKPLGETLQYRTVPPTSGPHWPRWADCGVYQQGVPDEMVVHNMEHGHVIISHNLDPEKARTLEDVVRRLVDFDTFGVLRPYPEIGPGMVAMTAWGFIDQMPGVHAQRISSFYAAHHANRYSEETQAVGPIPCR